MCRTKAQKKENANKTHTNTHTHWVTAAGGNSVIFVIESSAALFFYLAYS